MEDPLIFGGLAVLVASLGIMYAVVFRMIRVVNQDPGPKGKIPIYALLPRMTQLYEPIQRYRTAKGKDLLYRALLLGWALFAVGFVAVLSGKFVDWFLHK
jgi:hypothetical protein